VHFERVIIAHVAGVEEANFYWSGKNVAHGHIVTKKFYANQIHNAAK